MNTVVMFFSVRTKKLPFRLLQVRWLEAAGFAGFWNTRTNHGRAQERRVCVLSGSIRISGRSVDLEIPRIGLVHNRLCIMMGIDQ